MNRASIHPPYLTVPFLASTKTPGVGMVTVTPPSTCCLNRIEPRFEPRTVYAPPFFLLSSFLCDPLCPFVVKEFPRLLHIRIPFSILHSPSSNHHPLNTEYRKLIADAHSLFTVLRSLFSFLFSQRSTITIQSTQAVDEEDRQPEQCHRARLVDGGSRDVHVEEHDQDAQRDLGCHRRASASPARAGSPADNPASSQRR